MPPQAIEAQRRVHIFPDGTEVARRWLGSDNQPQFQLYNLQEINMLPIQAILWPTDESEAAMRALKTAVELAKDFKAKLFALRIITQVPTIPETGFSSATLTPSFDVALYEQKLIETARDVLQKTLAEQVPQSIEVETQVEMGTPAEAIVAFAKKNNISLIVMSTHGRTGMNRFMLGSVTEKTIRLSSVPVLTIPGGTGEK